MKPKIDKKDLNNYTEFIKATIASGKKVALFRMKSETGKLYNMNTLNKYGRRPYFYFHFNTWADQSNRHNWSKNSAVDYMIRRMKDNTMYGKHFKCIVDLEDGVLYYNFAKHRIDISEFVLSLVAEKRKKLFLNIRI